MLASRWSTLSRGRVNPLPPGVIAVVGTIAGFAGYRTLGFGVAVGALLAYVNGLLLSRRVDMASLSGNVGNAMIVMQMGLLVTLTIVGLATFALVRISVGLAVASAAGFAVTQLLILGAYYWTHGRRDPATGSTG